MPGRRKIQIDFDEMLSIANELGQESQAVEQITNRMMNLVGQLKSGGWAARWTMAAPPSSGSATSSRSLNKTPVHSLVAVQIRSLPSTYHNPLRHLVNLAGCVSGRI